MSSFLMETMFKRLSLLINNKGSSLLFSKGVHWEARTSLKNCLLHNICNCFTRYKNSRYSRSFNVVHKVIQNTPEYLWIYLLVIKSIIFSEHNSVLNKLNIMSFYNLSRFTRYSSYFSKNGRML